MVSLSGVSRACFSRLIACPFALKAGPRWAVMPLALHNSRWAEGLHVSLGPVWMDPRLSHVSLLSLIPPCTSHPGTPCIPTPYLLFLELGQKSLRLGELRGIKVPSSQFLALGDGRLQIRNAPRVHGSLQSSNSSLLSLPKPGTGSWGTCEQCNEQRRQGRDTQRR